MIDELDTAVKKSKATATNNWDDDENGVSGQMYKNSKTIQELDKRLDAAYKKRNKIFDTAEYDDDIYNAGREFHETASKTVDELLGEYGKKYISDINTDSDGYKTAKEVCLKIIESSDWHDIGNNRNHPNAWLYYH